MLNKEQISQINEKVIKEKLTIPRLARKITASNGRLTKMLNQEMECKNIEKRLLDWLYN